MRWKNSMSQSGSQERFPIFPSARTYNTSKSQQISCTRGYGGAYTSPLAR